MSEADMLLRVLFEYATYDQAGKLAESIEGAVIRADIQSAGGMPNLERDLAELRQIIALRYEAVEHERRTG